MENVGTKGAKAKLTLKRRRPPESYSYPEAPERYLEDVNGLRREGLRKAERATVAFEDLVERCLLDDNEAARLVPRIRGALSRARDDLDTMRDALSYAMWEIRALRAKLARRDAAIAATREPMQ